jgi:hypothetical protein
MRAMNPRSFAILFLGAAFPLLYACHTSSSASGTPPGLYCRAMLASEQICYGYTNLDPEQKTAVSDACTSSLQGTVSGSCPAGQLGCCTTSTAGYETTECYYTGSASAFESGCNAGGGKWMGGGSSNDGGTTSPDGGVRPGPDGSTGPTGDAAGYGPMGTCSAGQTQCPKGCVDEGTDVNNCGSCGYACPAGPNGTTAGCSAGQCTYACDSPGETLCGNGNGNGGNGGNGRCVDLQTSQDNCGQCDNFCQASFGAVASCQQGVCQSSCPAGQAMCQGQCIPVTSDPSNCGGCGTTCGANTVCTNGACVAGCSDGYTLCNGVCTSLDQDSNNCGTCGNVCPYTASGCESGTCTCEVYCVDQVGDPYCCKGGQQCYQNGCQ